MKKAHLILTLLIAFGTLTILSAAAVPPPGGKVKPLTLQLKWKYKTDWDWEIRLSERVIKESQSFRRPVWNGFYTYYAKYINANDKSTRLVARGLKSAIADYRNSGKWSAKDEIMFVVSMVQHLRYQLDSENGSEDYTKLPIETLLDKAGDCEDKAILAAALLKRMGHDVKLIFLESPDKSRSHLALGVHFKQYISGTYWEQSGKKYYYIETTYPGWVPGELPKEWDDGLGIVIHVP